MTLKDKVALVTGGGSGIGRACVLDLAAAGVAIVVGDVDETGGEETVQAVLDRGGRALFQRADVTRGDEVAALVQTAVETFGRLDVAVNNAGIYGGIQDRTHELAEADFDRIIAINLKGVWLCMKHEIPVMQAQGQGVIVNVASVAGIVGSPKGAAYTASKHGVIGLTKSAALEYAKRGIRVNAVCPSYTETPMLQDVRDKNPQMEKLTLMAIPMKRLGKPEEIAAGVLWLCSDESSFVTGHSLIIDGGLTAI